ncbi:MAG: bifunctional oligoribonuclease/PAP phosphatase NrnA [Erysipelotrichales bacterium]|nr:bifunctional oligoribonuclease/PAP phosphatase NrnA [Erysipelotrichales bacterium]
MFKDIIEAIEAEPIITIYPHTSPDGDALGSCFGFRELLKAKYPSKEIYVLGQHSKDEGEYFPCFDDVDDETIKKSLALSLDTANFGRVDEPRIKLAKKIIKIDHHPDREPFGDISYVDDTMSSCCEIIALIGKELYGNEKFPYDAARYLYSGLLTDTMGFSTSNSNAHSLETGAFLVSHGLNMNEISYQLTSKDITIYNYITKVRSAAVIEGKFLSAVIKKELYQESGLSFDEAKNCVSEFVKVRGLTVWSLFVENDNPNDDYKYQGSLRSRDVICNDIAYNHNGGGHLVAAGCKIKDDEELEVILKELRERANG